MGRKSAAAVAVGNDKVLRPDGGDVSTVRSENSSSVSQRAQTDGEVRRTVVSTEERVVVTRRGPSIQHSKDCAYEYKEDQWERSPKTDYTYSRTGSYSHRLAQNGYVSPNMSRRGLHRVCTNSAISVSSNNSDNTSLNSTTDGSVSVNARLAESRSFTGASSTIFGSSSTTHHHQTAGVVPRSMKSRVGVQTQTSRESSVEMEDIHLSYPSTGRSDWTSRTDKHREYSGEASISKESSAWMGHGAVGSRYGLGERSDDELSDGEAERVSARFVDGQVVSQRPTLFYLFITTIVRIITEVTTFVRRPFHRKHAQPGPYGIAVTEKNSSGDNGTRRIRTAVVRATRSGVDDTLNLKVKDSHNNSMESSSKDLHDKATWWQRLIRIGRSDQSTRDSSDKPIEVLPLDAATSSMRTPPRETKRRRDNTTGTSARTVDKNSQQLQYSGLGITGILWTPFKILFFPIVRLFDGIATASHAVAGTAIGNDAEILSRTSGLRKSQGHCCSILWILLLPLLLVLFYYLLCCGMGGAGLAFLPAFLQTNDTSSSTSLASFFSFLDTSKPWLFSGHHDSTKSNLDPGVLVNVPTPPGGYKEPTGAHGSGDFSGPSSTGTRTTETTGFTWSEEDLNRRILVACKQSLADMSRGSTEADVQLSGLSAELAALRARLDEIVRGQETVNQRLNVGLSDHGASLDMEREQYEQKTLDLKSRLDALKVELDSLNSKQDAMQKIMETLLVEAVERQPPASTGTVTVEHLQGTGVDVARTEEAIETARLKMLKLHSDHVAEIELKLKELRDEQNKLTAGLTAAAAQFAKFDPASTGTITVEHLQGTGVDVARTEEAIETARLRMLKLHSDHVAEIELKLKELRDEQNKLTAGLTAATAQFANYDSKYSDDSQSITALEAQLKTLNDDVSRLNATLRDELLFLKSSSCCRNITELQDLIRSGVRSYMAMVQTGGDAGEGSEPGSSSVFALWLNSQLNRPGDFDDKIKAVSLRIDEALRAAEAERAAADQRAAAADTAAATDRAAALVVAADLSAKIKTLEQKQNAAAAEKEKDGESSFTASVTGVGVGGGGAGVSEGGDKCVTCAGAITAEDVRALITKELKLYDADKTGMFDFALESAGGSVVNTRCTKNFMPRTALFSVFGVPLWYASNSPRVTIQPGIQPGECWAFEGTGHLVVQLSSRPLIVEEVVIEHIPRRLSPHGRLDSAPQNFSILGLQEEYDPLPVILGNFTYSIDKDEPLQMFKVNNSEEKTFNMVELVIESNHGHKEYTCLYRFRVHGKMPTTTTTK